ncbi:alpha/beta hydrolase [Robiginitalea sp. IMCC43444]|uniref:alpha/beta hydrolase n=1 Tax=Robiginitalea sp. IMCC43444 TaxID=3459121 RepID=UPI00404358A1
MEEQFFSWAGTQIYGYWAIPGKPRGTVLLVHGFGEHSGRYREAVVPFLCKQGLAVFAFDLVGHGKSAGKRGHCQGYGQLMGLLSEAFAETQNRFPALPLFLYGHSMGGNLVLNFTLRHGGPQKGIIASSPYLKLAFEPPAWKMYLGRMLQKIAPAVTIPSGLDPAGISRDAEEVRLYQSDPLVHGRVSPAYSFPVIEAGKAILEKAGEISIPVLVLHGEADPIIDVEGSVTFSEKAPNSQLVLFPGAYHELHHESEREAFFSEIGKWLQSFIE